ncbi:MAG TPA: hypothetical protein DEA22_05225 [Blastocatellia bacterium]|nr:hypothetical protein [Blastocatellia bacterium]
MLSLTVYPIIWLVVWGAILVFLALLILRLIFSYADPNPFGAIGRFSFKIRKITERYVYPATRFLSTFRVDIRLAPLVTAFIALVLTYFGMQIIGNAFFIVDGLSASISAGNVRAVIGFIIYGLLSIFVLFLVIRFVGQWFVFARNTFLAFVYKVTDPIMIPAQRLIPRVGMFDFSLLVVLILVSILQTAVIALLVR